MRASTIFDQRGRAWLYGSARQPMTRPNAQTKGIQTSLPAAPPTAQAMCNADGQKPHWPLRGYNWAVQVAVDLKGQGG